MLKSFLSILTGRIQPGVENPPASSHRPPVKAQKPEVREFVHLGYQFRILLSESNATIEKLVFKGKLEETHLGTKLVPSDDWNWQYISQFTAASFEDAFRQFVDSIVTETASLPADTVPKAAGGKAKQDLSNTPPVMKVVSDKKDRKQESNESPSQKQDSWTGSILEWGVKRFQNSSTRQFYDSFFVEIRLNNGYKKVLKGVLLEKALEDSGANKGDLVKVKLLGHEYVNVTDPNTNATTRALMGIWEMQRV